MYKIYIASPFFDDASRSWVSAKEEEFKGFNKNYFSPREDGINFNKEGLSPEVRANRIRGIFQNNIDNLRTCQDVIANLNYCNGKIDIGTLWEVGYWIGLTGSMDTHNIDCAPEIRPLIETIIHNLTIIRYKGDKTTEKTSMTLLVPDCSNEESERIKATARFLGNPFLIKYTDRYLRNFEIDNSTEYIILTDNFPIEYFLLMGYLYATDYDYFTASFRGYGSNVMIAASSKGHMMIPSFTDFTYSRNLL